LSHPHLPAPPCHAGGGGAPSPPQSVARPPPTLPTTPLIPVLASSSSSSSSSSSCPTSYPYRTPLVQALLGAATSLSAKRRPCSWIEREELSALSELHNITLYLERERAGGVVGGSGGQNSTLYLEDLEGSEREPPETVTGNLVAASTLLEKALELLDAESTPLVPVPATAPAVRDKKKKKALDLLDVQSTGLVPMPATATSEKAVRDNRLTPDWRGGVGGGGSGGGGPLRAAIAAKLSPDWVHAQVELARCCSRRMLTYADVC
jgi:hypothetical protein